MNLLFIGDIVGRPGRDLVRRHARALAAHTGAQLVIANGENAAGGAGITRENAYEILGAGVDVITSGNHVWDKRETLEFIGAEPRLVRPANYPGDAPGHGSVVVAAANGVQVGVVNLMGRVFMTPIDDPFRVADREIARVKATGAQVIFVDMHAEATSEKMALAHYLDGQVAAVIGTHTHVQTADERILPGGTACLTDVGMTGPHDGIIGMDTEAVLARFLTGRPGRFETASGDHRLNAVTIAVNEATGSATAITRISLSVDELAAITDAVTAGAKA